MQQEHTDFDANGKTLDPMQLKHLERNFYSWATLAKEGARKSSRTRILLFFLIIRYTGAKLHEVLKLNPRTDINASRRVIIFRDADREDRFREVEISRHLTQELERLFSLSRIKLERFFSIDPAYVRKKFYERAQSCGFHKQQGGPEMLRKARAMELLQNNLPLQAVQRLLGNSSSHLSLPANMGSADEDLSEMTRLYMERETGGKTSARNSFFGKVSALERDEVQTLVEMTTLDGDTLRTMITNTSVERLGLRIGRMISAEVKAPWLIVERCDRSGESGAENRREGRISAITMGKINTECIVRLFDGTEMCVILSSRACADLKLAEGERVRVLFSAYAPVLHSD